MPKKLLSLLAEEITEQGFGRYFKDYTLPSGQRVEDVKNIDLSTGKPIDIPIPSTEVLPNDIEDNENYVGPNNEPLKDNDIVDISGQSTYRRKNERLNPRKYFMLHHTAGRGTAQGVVSVLNNRIPRLGVQWIIDRNGIVYRGLPDGSRGAHVAYQRNNMKHVNNSNTEGVEIIADDDSDVLDLQCKSALKLVKKLGYSLSDIYTHGQVSTNKQATEGQKCKAYFVKYWGTPFNMIDKNSEEIKNKVEPSKVVGGDYNKSDRNYSKNGNLSSSELTLVMNDLKGQKEYLSNAAAIQFNKMVVDAKKQGFNITLTDAYRVCGQPGDYAKGKWTQWAAWEIKIKGGNDAASPVPNNKKTWNEKGGGYCTSNHGFGNAIDVSDGKAWIRMNGEKYGWYWGEAPSENWHFTFCGEGVVNPPGYCFKSYVKSKIKIKKNENPTKSESNRLPTNIQKLIDKLKTDWGVNITKSHIDKEYEMEGDVRPDAGGVNEVALTKIEKLISDCKKANPTVNFPNTIKHGVSGLVSGYRSYTDQVTNFGNKVKNEGRSIDNVQSSNTLPGFSQHHTGKAFDIFSTETSWWNTNSDVKKWVANNCKKYGFEVTYTKTNKLRIPEPWHLFYK